MERLALSPREAARSLGCNEMYVRNAVRDGALVVHQIGAKSCILVDDLKTWVRSHPTVKAKVVSHV
jgi:excisionase family DNA binding protein